MQPIRDLIKGNCETTPQGVIQTGWILTWDGVALPDSAEEHPVSLAISSDRKRLTVRYGNGDEASTPMVFSHTQPDIWMTVLKVQASAYPGEWRWTYINTTGRTQYRSNSMSA